MFQLNKTTQASSLKLTLLLLLLNSFLHSQISTPNKILFNVYSQLQKAKDYSVDVNIKVDLPFIRMLPINAKIFVKQPNKFKVESKSIAIVPRQGFDQLNKVLNDTSQFTAIAQSTETINNVISNLINVIPLQDTSDLVLAKLWVDTKQNVILKSLLTTKTNGTILTEYTYGKYFNYGLPDLMKFTVDIKKFKIPKSIAADINKNIAKTDDKEKKKGVIIIKLSNYIINKGITDSFFKDRK